MTEADRQGLQALGATRLQVRVGAAVLVFVALVALVEIGLAFVPWFAGNSLRSMIYTPPEVTRAQYERYLTLRDPLLGWPALKEGRRQPVARFSPSFPEVREWCVTLYGDSMTFAEEVSDDEAWGDALAQRLGCPVGNFGVGGYGTDQAFLRFINNPGDRAAVTIVGVFPDNLRRNVNQYRYFLTGGETLGLKPRFVLENGALRLVSIPDLTYDQFIAGLREPRTMFPYEVFIPGSRRGPVFWSFPFMLSAINLARTDQVRNYVRGRPTWINFAEADDDSQAVSTTAAIVAEFQRRVATDKTVLAILYPTPASYSQDRRTGVATLGALAAAFAERGVPTRDLTEDFAAHLGDRSFCDLMTGPGCVGHYNAEGNRVVAEAVQRFIAAKRPLP